MIGVRRWLGAALCACAVLLPAAAGQDWRDRALASFDETWRTINDTFYDPTFGGLDWPAVKAELRPRVEAAASPDVARDAIRDMLSRLKRSHFALLSASAAEALPGPASVPIDIRISGPDALITRVTDPAAAKAGLAPGQAIVSINGQEVADLLQKAEGADPRSRNLDAWRRVNHVLYGLEGSTATLRVRSVSGALRTVDTRRALGAGEIVTLGNLPPLRVAVEAREVRTPRGRRAGTIWFSVWMTQVGEPFARAIDQFRKHDGLVIDLRGNPGGLAGMMIGVSGHMIAEPLLLGTMHTRQTKLSFNVNPRTVTSDGRRVEPFAGPVAILVDELTGSTSETFAGALQSLGRARVFGRATMGQAMPAMTRLLPNGDVLLHAVGDFVTSTGRSLEGPGVLPDVAVPLSARALSLGRDEPLQAALRWLDTAKK